MSSSFFFRFATGNKDTLLTIPKAQGINSHLRVSHLFFRKASATRYPISLLMHATIPHSTCHQLIPSRALLVASAPPQRLSSHHSTLPRVCLHAFVSTTVLITTSAPQGILGCCVLPLDAPGLPLGGAPTPSTCFSVTAMPEVCSCHVSSGKIAHLSEPQRQTLRLANPCQVLLIAPPPPCLAVGVRCPSKVAAACSSPKICLQVTR